MKKSKSLANSSRSSKGSSEIILSICVPVRNDLTMAKEFVEQMVKQTEKPEEVIFVDGYSTDGSYEFLVEASKKYKWLKVERLNTNIVTASSGRNQAMRHSKGRYVYVVDVDIKLEQDFVKKMRKELSTCKDPIFFFKVRSYPSMEFKGIWHKIYFLKDNAKGIIEGGFLTVHRRDALIFYPEEYFYGDDQVYQNQLIKMLKNVNCTYSKETYWVNSKSVENFREVFNRYFKYGYTSPEFALNNLSTIMQKLKVFLGWFSIPFFPLLLLGMLRGFYYVLFLLRRYGFIVLLFPFTDMLVMILFSLGFYSRIFDEVLRLFGLKKAWNKRD